MLYAWPSACIFRLTRHSTLIEAFSCGESAVVSIATAKSAASYRSRQRRVRKDNADAAVFAESGTPAAARKAHSPGTHHVTLHGRSACLSYGTQVQTKFDQTRSAGYTERARAA